MEEKLNAIIMQNKAIINLCQVILGTLGMSIDKINEITDIIREDIDKEMEKGE